MKKILIILAFIIFPTHSFAYIDIENHWGKDYINYLSEIDIVSGYPDGTFRPDNNVTYAEFITMLAKTLGLNIEEVEGEWAIKFAEAIKKEGIINSFDNLEADIFREEVIKMLVKSGRNSKIAYNSKSTGKILFNDMFNADKETKNSVEILFNSGIVKGYSDRTIRLKDELTRAEACTFICNFIKNKDILDNYELNRFNNYYGETLFVSYKDLPYELCEWKNGNENKTLVTTSIKSIDFFEFTSDYSGKYKDIFNEIYTSENPYFQFRKKVGDNKYVIAIEFITKNNSDYQTVVGHNYLTVEFPEEDIEIVDSFDIDEIEKQREKRAYNGVKIYPEQQKEMTAFYVVDKFPEEVIKLNRYITTMYDEKNKMVVDVESYNSLVIGNLE